MMKNKKHKNIQGQISSLRERMGFVKESFGNIQQGISVRQKVLQAIAGRASKGPSLSKEGGKIKG